VSTLTQIVEAPSVSGPEVLDWLEIAARPRKATALVAVLRESGIDASVARMADRGVWTQMATTAKVRPPSSTTIAMVIEILDGAEEMEPECSCRQTDVDLADARGCELHDSQSQYRRQAEKPLAVERPEQSEPATSEEVPF
jgi:hypothetical protein